MGCHIWHLIMFCDRTLCPWGLHILYINLLNWTHSKNVNYAGCLAVLLPFDNLPLIKFLGLIKSQFSFPHIEHFELFVHTRRLIKVCSIFFFSIFLLLRWLTQTVMPGGTVVVCDWLHAQGKPWGSVEMFPLGLACPLPGGNPFFIFKVPEAGQTTTMLVILSSLFICDILCLNFSPSAPSLLTL